MNLSTSKRVIIILMTLLILSNTPVYIYAEEYTDDLILKDTGNIQPYYNIIEQPFLSVRADSIEVSLVTYKYASLKINLKVYQEKGSSWSLVVNKTFSENGDRLSGKIDYDFQSGETYRVIAEFYADTEYDKIEQYYMS